MKFSVWAKQQGLTYKGAWKMFHAGKLPLPAEQLPVGTIIVHPAETKPQGVALYARVSRADQKADLDRQLARLSEYVAERRLLVVESVREVGSGLNGHRRNMLKLLSNPQVNAIVVEHRERLMRFGFEYVEAALSAQGRRLIVVEPDEMTDDIVPDLHEVMVSMGARLYGKRSARNRVQKALNALHEPEVTSP
ncbi:MAG: IS607 family transposase [Acidiferrobacter sp.]